MPWPRNEERRPRRPSRESGVLEIALGGGDKIKITAAAHIPPSRHPVGCRCGCMTRLPWIDDPDCVRHLPIGQAPDWGSYDVETLGLVPHDRGNCASCQAVGS